MPQSQSCDCPLELIGHNSKDSWKFVLQIKTRASLVCVNSQFISCVSAVVEFDYYLISSIYWCQSLFVKGIFAWFANHGGAEGLRKNS